jgi:hypothetical protein
VAVVPYAVVVPSGGWRQDDGRSEPVVSGVVWRRSFQQRAWAVMSALNSSIIAGVTVGRHWVMAAR